ncbi:MAG TPA: hypothetical protein VEB19_07340 [Gemmatimonadaceae bacterium]|nr:hypothetical protein [Gemmatimonadaceae bacterium]
MRAISGIALLVVAACGPRTTPTPAPPDLRAQAAAFFEHYTVSIRNGERQRLASYYMPTGATVIVNGRGKFETPSQIAAIYQGEGWQPPASFVWEGLQFEQLNDRQVAATGHFVWVSRAGAESIRVVYFGLLENTADGLRIRIEHETVAPRS